MEEKKKWVIVGIGIAFSFVAFVFLLIAFVMHFMKGDAYELSLEAISNNSEVAGLLGRPLTPSWYVLGSIETSGPSGNAALEYAIGGAKRDASAYVYAAKSDGEWRLDKVVVEIDSTDDRIFVVGSEE